MKRCSNQLERSPIQTVTLNFDNDLHSWDRHVDGALALIQLRGVSQLRNRVGRCIFSEIVNDPNAYAPSVSNHQQLINCLQRRVRVPLRLVNWTIETRNHETAQDAPAAQLAGIIVNACSVLALVKEEMTDDAKHPHLISNLLSVDNDLVSWSNSIPSEYGLEAVTTPDSSILTYLGRYDIYPSVAIAHTWNLLRCARIILRQALVGAISTHSGFVQVPASPPSSLPISPRHILRISDTAINENASLICYSVPYILRLCGKPASPENPHLRAACAVHLLWPLYIAGTAYTRNDALREWVIARMESIKGATGIQRAGLVASRITPGLATPNESGLSPQSVRDEVVGNGAMTKACFLCDSCDAQECAHVVGNHDSAVPILEAEGLINFGLRSPLNAVPLCATCHRVFDNMTDPQVTFYPADLDFFIRFELRDRARRRKLPGPSKRRVPTARQYIQHSGGGLYRRVFFRWNRVDRRDGWVPPGPDPAPWKGSPIAVIRRATAVLTSPRGAGIPPEDHKRLFILWQLYFGGAQGDEAAEAAGPKYRDNDDDENFGLGEDYQRAGDEPERDQEKEGEEDDGEEGEEGTMDLEAVDAESERDEEDEEDDEESEGEGDEDWKPKINIQRLKLKRFGRDSTSQDKIRSLGLGYFSR
ncbi:uncharacterized protein DSM5745_10160 [Aspergillus mulundensis]|uniref:HNH nuclease domain-containing protein n=1 Tax=Aspergillus mulundensis TaxID=1810919 RepID=A0A3D8QMN0_9EURO|nr:hypothetical protein DSM5745_10160 [Aspergillus mulundensis]RDW63049.1 hypothetical protein DSM5745_10160 [Aspergillus mulundensis]